MLRNFFVSQILLIMLFLCLCENASAFDFSFKKRDYIYIVGSSTISPLMAAVSEEFSRNQNLKADPIVTPVVESTGTISGIELFCGGIGKKYPDFVNASRQIDKSEIARCKANGVSDVVEVKIGYDGIVIGNSVMGKKMKLSQEQIFLAMAQKVVDKNNGKLIDNPYVKWNQIDPSLPDKKILIYVPPLTSGTRDIFVDIVMSDSCLARKEFIAAFADIELRKQHCRKFRTDGVVVESGENDVLIIKNLKDDPDAVGIFGFDFLVANRKEIQPLIINNVEPSFATISTKKYSLSRPLFVYFKREHLNNIPKMRNFVEEIISPEAIGSNGYLLHNGLISLSDKELAGVRKNVMEQL